jgi:hypothetical protein
MKRAMKTDNALKKCIQGLKSKHEIIIKEELKLDIITLLEKKEEVDWKRLVDSLIFIIEHLKRSEQRGRFL